LSAGKGEQAFSGRRSGRPACLPAVIGQECPTSLQLPLLRTNLMLRNFKDVAAAVSCRDIFAPTEWGGYSCPANAGTN